MARLFISAAHKSSGKTTLTIGLCAALTTRGIKVAPFKKGPDYIDPMWLTRAAKQPCHNLDFNTMHPDEILGVFSRYASAADIAIIEGNKGLYDGLDLEGANSNAALAKQLKSPVILVIDARGMTRGIAPLILGYQQFDHDIQIAGVILNQLGGHRHEQKLRAVIEHYTDVRVLGAVQFDESLSIKERHLGLIPANEAPTVEARIQALATRIAAQTDLDKIMQIANTVPALPTTSTQRNIAAEQHQVRIGVARDAAFGFYYNDDLQALQNAGAELVFFDTLHDTTLPAVDGLIIGGGFPETHMTALENNSAMRNAIHHAIEAGMPAYAECGGLMYLSRSLQWRDRQHAMVGIIPGDIIMHERPQGRGYVQLKSTHQAYWEIRDEIDSQVIAAHEFHYSSIENLPADTQYAYEVLRGQGVDGKNDGIIYKNLLASYTHLRHCRQSPWASQFVNFVKHQKLIQPKVNQV